MEQLEKIIELLQDANKLAETSKADLVAYLINMCLLEARSQLGHYEKK
jgi:hypothetical protein